MIRNFCIDCMIACAVFMILWGCLPALLAQEEPVQPKGGISAPTYSNRCCRWGVVFGVGGGTSGPCITDRAEITNWCKNPGKIDCSGNFRSCVCRDWGLTVNGVTTWKCDCS